jgi:elongation factor Ts
MPPISASDVKRLRDATGAGMMDCKRALVDADGDFDRAAALVRERTGARVSDRVRGRTADEGLVHAYLHAPNRDLPPRVGVLIELNCETDFVAKGAGFRELANNVALHVAALKPQVITVDELDPEVVGAEREFAEKQARDQGKPDHIIDKIVEGRLQAFYRERVLLEQPYVRDDKRTVRQLVEEFQRTSGEKIVISRMARFEVGA